MDHAAAQGHREVEDFLFEEVRKRTIDAECEYRRSIIEQHQQWRLRCAAEKGQKDRVKFLIGKSEVGLNDVPHSLREDLAPDSYKRYYPTP